MSKISYSGYKKYIQCPQLYKFHYEDRLRPINTTSDLVFGVAIDKALNAMLLETDNPFDVFKAAFEWKDLKNVFWDKKDLQFEMFTDEQLHALASDPDEYLIWAGLRIKGRLMLEAYRDLILPKIRSVISVQKNLGNRSGVLDAILDMKEYGIVLIDHKTSRMPYQPDAIENDTQLALYSIDQGISKVGYIVLNKTFKFVKICKRCGKDGSNSLHKTCNWDVDGTRCHGSFDRKPDMSKIIQVIIQDSPQINKDLITESIELVENCINKKQYYRNLSACGNMYGKRCPYFNKCWKNSDEGLEVKQETKEKKDE
jgi:hypothetical protein